MDAVLEGQHRYYGTTTLCPICDALLPGSVVRAGDGVFVTRECPQHGPFAGLVCSDVAWWDALPRFDVPPARPHRPRRPRVKGCPDDCGLCVAHQQSAGTVAIEISNRCNSVCPICLGDNQGTFELSPDEVRRAVDSVIATEGRIEVLALSGGEPTIHPQLGEILQALQRPEVARINLNSNGRRIAEDDAFLDQLARFPNVYVALHADGPGAPAMRGVAAELQERALDRLIRWGIAVVPLIVAARGMNDQSLGQHALALLRRSPLVRSVVISMMTYAGHGGTAFPGDPRTRLTIPGALDCLEQGSGGVLRKRDFIPLPMPNPMCAAIGYFLVDQGDVTALIPLAEEARLVEAHQNSQIADAGTGLEPLLRDTIDRVYAGATEVAEPERVLAHLRRLVVDLFPPEGLAEDERRRRAEGRIRWIYLFQFMDPWTFDTRRAAKCSCQHVMPDGTMMPSCGYYARHRYRDPRFPVRPAPAVGAGG